MKKISVVTPCYNEEDNVRDVWAAVKALFDGPLAGYEREHIFADNASTDSTPRILREIALGPRRVPHRQHANRCLPDRRRILPQHFCRWSAGFEFRQRRIHQTLNRPAHRVFRRWYVEELVAGLGRAADPSSPEAAHLPETFEGRLLREYEELSAAYSQLVRETHRVA